LRLKTASARPAKAPVQLVATRWGSRLATALAAERRTKWARSWKRLWVPAQGLLVREPVPEIPDPVLDDLSIGRARRSHEVLAESADSLVHVSLAFVRGCDDWQHGVHAAVDRVGVLEVADGFVVVRFLEKLLSAQEHRMCAFVVTPAHLRLLAGGGIIAGRLLREHWDRDEHTNRR